MKEGDFFLYFDVEDRKKLVSKYGTTDKQKIKKLIHDEAITETKPQNPKERFQRLKATELEIKCFKELKNLNLPMEQIVDVLTGNQTLESISYPKSKQDTNPNLNHNFFCDTCKHQHFGFGDKLCTLSSCACGVRGV